jgi:hypothetical protein
MSASHDDEEEKTESVEMDGKGGGLGSEISYFQDKEDVLRVIGLICLSGDEKEFEGHFEWLEPTLGKYQEQPVLLQESLPYMIDPLTEKLLNIIESDKVNMWANVVNNKHFDSICRVIQLICRVRGFKHVVKLFPHEVSHLEPTLSILHLHDKNTSYHSDKWETKYVLLLWLCIQSLIPFDICSIDSSQTSNTTSDAGASTSEIGELTPGSTETTLVQRIVRICNRFLADTGPTREAASACLSSLMTRPDMDLVVLSSFVNECCAKLHSWAAKGSKAEQELTTSNFEIIGVLHCVAQVFKKGHRSRLLPHASSILKECLLIAAQPNQTSIRKLTCKVVQRLGMAFLPPRVATWRYQRGSRSLVQNLGGGDSGSVENTRCDLDGRVSGDEENLKELERYIEDIELVVDLLLLCLSDKDTVVRWNAAKGIGRITMRLVRELGDDVVVAVFGLFCNEYDDAAWHGGALALAELTRRGLLLPERLGEVMPVLVKAINFDVLRGQHSVGSHVRDAACYVCWAFARAYSPDVMAPYIRELSAAMLITSLYDREINCRRAASAAFQENVGRQGNQNFPLGIEIITVADYFTLGKRNNAYLKIAPDIASMADDHHDVLMWHLLDVKVRHWDIDIRSVAAKAIAKLAPVNLERSLEALNDALETCFDSNLWVRHGSLMVVSEMVLEMHASEASSGVKVMDDDLVDKIMTLVPRLDKARMFRGRGGEILRAASCKLVESVARADMPVATKTKVALIEFLNENIKHPHDYIQQASADALRHALYAFFGRPAPGGGKEEGGGGPSVRLQDLTVSKYLKGLSEEENIAAARGYALAVGVLPEKLLLFPAGRLKEILEVLKSSASVTTKIAGEPDAECRRNCVTATIEIMERLMLSPMLDAECFRVAFDILLDASEDHSVDKRGDTGSWSRVAALRGMERLLYAQYNRTAFEQDNDATSLMVMTAYGPGQAVEAAGSGSGQSKVAFTICSLGYDAINSGSSNFEESHNLNLGMKSAATTMASTLVIPIPVIPRDALLSGSEEVGPIENRRVISVILKQLCEKLDTVRDVAGNCLVRLLQLPGNAYMPPDKDLLMESFIRGTVAESAEGQRVNWAHPAHVFPRLSSVLGESDNYFHAIISGLIIAVGGLSETVVRESTKVLLQFTKQAKDAESRGATRPIRIKHLGDSLLLLLRENSGDDRVVVPLLKTLILLFRNGVFEGQEFDEGPLSVDSGSGPTSFSQSILDCVHVEYSSSGNVIKIKLCVDVFLQMFLFSEPVRGRAYKYVVICLGHKYPSVRKYAAEQLYLQCLSDQCSTGPSIEDVIERVGGSNNVARKCGLARDAASLEEAQNLLITTAWDDSVKDARAARLKYCSVTGLKMQVKRTDPNTEKPKETKPKDELDSYASLVAEAGY